MKKLLFLFLLPSVVFGDFEFNAGYRKRSRDQIEREKIITKALELEDRLNQLVIGQEEAVKITSDAIIRFAAGVNDPLKPIASLLYCGPSGCGKTELAKQLANVLYNDESRFIRFNMAEFTNEYSIQRLIGAAPGYVNHEEGGQLINALVKQPFAVVLFDEIEKAHPKVIKLFLQLFDEGYITSNKNKKIDCRGCIFILTSNIAASEIAMLSERGYSNDEILEDVQPYITQALSVELYNRLDPVLFNVLSEGVKESIVHKMLAELATRVADSKQLTIEFDPSVIDYLVSAGFDPELGARPVKRMIEKEMTPLIAKALIRGQFKAGDRLLLTLEEDRLILIRS